MQRMITTRPARGMIVLDMQERIRPLLTYRHGPPEQGVGNVVRLVTAARENDVPIMLVRQFAGGPVLPEIGEAAGDAPVIWKAGRSGYSSLEFMRVLAEWNVREWVMAGFNRIRCVWDTVGDMHKDGHRIWTADQLLFGNRNATESEEDIAAALRFYRSHTRFCETFEEVAAAIGVFNHPMQV